MIGRSSTEDERAPTIHLGLGPAPHHKAEYIDVIRHVDHQNHSAPVRGQAHISFNGRCRDECLNEHLFVTIDEARAEIEKWRIDYNTARPHSGLGKLTPEEFAQKHRVSYPADPESVCLSVA